MEKENGCFTNPLLQNLEKINQKEMRRNEEEKREKAKKPFHTNFCLQVAGALTGALIGALLGVVVALSVVIALLKPFCSACKSLKAARGVAVETGAATGAGIDAKAVAAGVVGVAALVGVVAGAVVSGGACSSLAVGVVGVVALVGVVAGAVVSGGACSSLAACVVGVVGGVTGWKAAEEADSVYNAMTKAAKLNCENATVVVEKIRELVALAFEEKKKDN